MKLYAVIHEMISGNQKITLVNAHSEQGAKKVYLKYFKLGGLGSQLKVEEVNTSKPSVIVSVTQEEK